MDRPWQTYLFKLLYSVWFKTTLRISLVVQWLRIHLPMLETWIQSLLWEDSREKAMAPHSSTLAWKIQWMEEPGRLQSGMTEWLHFHFSLSCIGEQNGTPLQYSCLENPRDRGAWWAAVYGVAQSRTLLKRLSREDSTCHRATKPVSHNSWSPHALEPMLCNWRVASTHHN